MKKITLLAMLVAVSILMQLIESFFPLGLLIPGYKIGLANIASLFALYAFDVKSMVMVTFLRVFLASLATGTLFSIPFLLSISGCTLACLAMALAKKSGWFTIYGVSVAGAASHTFGQVLAIGFLYQQSLFQVLLPVLIALSVLSGLCIAYLAQILLQRLARSELSLLKREKRGPEE